MDEGREAGAAQEEMRVRVCILIRPGRGHTYHAGPHGEALGWLGGREGRASGRLRLEPLSGFLREGQVGQEEQQLWELE